MKKTMIKIALGATALLLVASLSQPALASCSPIAAPLSNFSLSGNASSIHRFNWSVDQNYGPGYLISYTEAALDSASLDGVFWAIGSGNPTFGPGDDNGSFGVTNWIQPCDPGSCGSTSTFYYAAKFPSIGWGSNGAIDGCVLNSATANDCTCVMLTHMGNSGPEFAVFSAMADATARTEFDLPGAASLELFPIPAPEVVVSVRDAVTNDLTLDVRAPVPMGGIYEQDGCNCGVQFVVKEFVRPRGQVGSPGTNDPAQYGDPTGSDPTNLGAVDQIQSLCGAANNDVWLATQLITDSGFLSGFVSNPSTKIECGPNLADPDDPVKKKFPVARPDERPTRGGRSGR